MYVKSDIHFLCSLKMSKLPCFMSGRHARESTDCEDMDNLIDAVTYALQSRDLRILRSRSFEVKI